MQSFMIRLFGICLGTLLSITSAATQPILSGSDRFHPVIAKNGMVASQQATASRIGVEILKRGGNAVDAAVAVGFALAVTLPRAGNLGGGGFMLVHLAGPEKTIAIDYRETAPKAAFRDMFLDDKGEADKQKSRFSGLAVGVPGTVAGLELAHQKYGSGRLTLAELIEPALKLAREGLVVSQSLSDALAWGAKRLGKDPEAQRIFLKGGAGAPMPGEILKQTDLARSLTAIAENGASAFYQGRIAEQIVSTVKEAGGQMAVEDLKDYQAIEREVVWGTYRGHKVASMPPPSSGGIHIVQILNMLEAYDISASGAGSAKTIHLMAEAMRRAYADRSKFLGDPDFIDIPQKGLTSKAYAKALVSQINDDHATPSNKVAPGKPVQYESDQTTHFSVVDKDGNAVSNTTTLNFSFGVGRVAKGSGILLNNELDDFSAKPGTPNAYGLIGGTANAVAPRKRPLSSMSPTFLFAGDDLILATGSPGGSRIITTVLQIIMNMVDHGMNIAEATAAPRIHHQWVPDEIRVEQGLSPDTLGVLKQKGHKIVEKRTMGSVQSVGIVRTEDGRFLTGASDPRRTGAATIGY